MMSLYPFVMYASQINILNAQNCYFNFLLLFFKLQFYGKKLFFNDFVNIVYTHD